MAVEDNELSYMVPREGESSVSVPVTLDYSGGRSQTTKMRWLWSVIGLVLLIAVEIGILISSNPLSMRLLFMFLIGYGSTIAIRFLLLEERKHRKEMKKRNSTDYSINMSDFWSIYEIVDEYCYFLSGHVGMFVMLEKGAIVGKNDSDEHENYEAITDAYTIIGASKLRVSHIDMMDQMGRDDRIRRVNRQLSKYQESGMRSLLEEIYRHLQSTAESRVTTYDVYLFMFKGDEEEFESNVRKVLACLLDANYSSYTVLNRTRIQTVASTLFNLHDFSVTSATREAFRNRQTSKKRLTPIRLVHNDGTVKEINKTTEEKREEAAERRNQEKLKRSEIARREVSAKSKKSRERKRALSKVVSKTTLSRVSIPVEGTTNLDEVIDLDNEVGSDGGFFALGDSSSTDNDTYFNILTEEDATERSNKKAKEDDFFDLGD